MLEPKRISPDDVPAAVEKALHYRLLNEPEQAESICRDVLACEPDNQQALVTLLLAFSDQFEMHSSVNLDMAKDLVAQLPGEYQQEYFAGIINERWGKAQLQKGLPRDIAIGWIRTAMRHYDRAEALSEPGDPDAILRWNTCARILTQWGDGASDSVPLTHDVVGGFGDDVPPR